MQRSKFQVHDSTEYFMNSVDRVCDKDYIPTNDDVLHVRIRTTAISKIEFTIEGKMYEMLDVGGQRGKRRKWIHLFDNVTAVLFVISISEYDQFLEEDESVNRMMESLKLFEQTVNNRYLNLTTFIIFFNKYDLFLEKIKYTSIKETFSDYNGSPHDAEETLTWLADMYLSANQTDRNKRAIYSHTTTATDTDLIKNVFMFVQDSIMRGMLRQSLF